MLRHWQLLWWQVLLTDFSPEVAAKCMNRLAKLSARFIGNRGFSIGIDDVTPAPALQAAKAELMRTGCAPVERLSCIVNSFPLPCDAVQQDPAADCCHVVASVLHPLSFGHCLGRPPLRVVDVRTWSLTS